MRSCDSELYDRLRGLLNENSRDVKAVASCGILPADTTLFDEPLAFQNVARRDRTAHREAWIRRGLQLSGAAELVFLDPDNGLEVSVSPLHAWQDPLRLL